MASINYKFPLLATVVVTALTLTGCGGGSKTVKVVKEYTLYDFTTTPVANTATLDATTLVKIDGIAREADVVVTNGIVDSVSPYYIDETASIVVKYDGTSLDAITINTTIENDTVTATPTTTTYSNFIDYVDTNGDVVVVTASSTTTDETRGLLIVDPYGSLFEYQSFGAWETIHEDYSGTKTVRIGLMSGGYITPVDDIPLDGTAAFDGFMVGYYVEPDGTPYVIVALTDIDVNFATDNMNFRTTQTQVIDIDSVLYDATDLNLAGTLNLYTVGEVRGQYIQGGISTTRGSNELTGMVDGYFYGPNAEEMGGLVYAVADTGIESIDASFGASRGAITITP